ncbi:MAG TPA: 4a-hydroxytetrahydrobiopterin dehydratase [Lichenihabitans sp.]|jgi:4a-hydroxytetrahydrobiopterin dehydratase|nr:4a-hydroxytetrahydrobiopterin dehydratase [Lichenihabitans sp.]
MASLASKTCTPCQGGVPPMTPQEAEKRQVDVPDWGLPDVGTRLERRYAFKDFAGAFAFVSKAAEIAEAEGHHPDITFGWGYALVSLFTHKIKGLHENDFIMAAKYDVVYAGMDKAKKA